MAAEEPLVSTPGTQAGLLNYLNVAPRVFKGPQGPGLQDFLELHNEETSLCHLGVLQRMRLWLMAALDLQSILSTTGT